jgi:hypothetical protein
MHKKLTEQTGVAVYFCDPHRAWQRGSNENTNGLVRQHRAKGTDLSAYSQEHLDAIADQINGRPRKGAGDTITTGGIPGVAPEQPATLHLRSLKTRVLHFRFEFAPVLCDSTVEIPENSEISFVNFPKSSAQQKINQHG